MSVARKRPAGVWASQKAVAERFDVSLYRVRELVKAGAVTTRRLPGGRVEVLAADVERVVRESVRPAGESVNTTTNR